MINNIDQLSSKELLALVDDSHAGDVPKPAKRMNVLKALYEVLGYDLTNGALLALVSEPSAELILATAGAGKTTAVQSKIVLEKLLRTVKGKPLDGSRILCIVYNKHNVKQMTKTQEKLANKIRSSSGMKIDTEIAAHTMHSYCLKWFNHYNHLSQFIGGTLIDPPRIVSQFKSLVALLFKEQQNQITDATIDNLISLYNLVKETMTEYEDCDSIELFQTIGLEKDLVVKLFNAYDKGKYRKNQYDYTDMLYELYNLLKHNESVRNYIQNHYDYIVADEVQDMTKIMMEILRLSKREDTPLVCIGDEDQNIYNFRGATIKTILDFEKTFDNAKVYSLSTNRRCGKNIVDLAKYLIEMNTLRYDKPMNAVRDGGNISYIPYIRHEDQIDDLILKLKCMSSEDLNQTCVCYRNRRSSSLLSCKLEQNQIPFHIMSGFKPYTAEVFQHMLSILRMLLFPYDRDEIINIYKVLPNISKNDVHSTMGYSVKTKNFDRPYEKKHFSEYDFGKMMGHPSCQRSMQLLMYISNNISTASMNTYMPALWKVFEDAFWKSKRYYNGNTDEDEMLTRAAIEFFDSPKPFNEFYENLGSRMDKCHINDQQKMGVCLSTFHSLKGLEFKNVFIIDLNDRIFPNFDKIEEGDYTEQLTLELKESETRLFFVAMTRAKDNLIFYYDKNNPSMYIPYLMNRKAQDTTDKMDLISGFDTTDLLEVEGDDLLSDDLFGDDLFARDDDDDLLSDDLLLEDSQDDSLLDDTPKPDEPDLSVGFLDTVIGRFF